MAQTASQVTTAIQAAFRHLFRLIDLDDRNTARAEARALLQPGTLSPSLCALLDGLLAFIERDGSAEKAHVRKALELDPENAHAHYWLATIHDRDGQIPEAAGSLERSLKINPRMAESWATYGGMALLGRNHDLAMHCYLTATRCDMDNAQYWGWLNQWLPRMQVKGDMQEERDLLVQALRRQKVEVSAILQLIYLLLQNSARVRELMGLAAAGTLHGQVQSGAALNLMDDDLFLLVLQRTTLHHAGYETLLTDLRRALLDAVTHRRVPAAARELVIRATSALAVYALATEFALHVTEAESAALAACRQQLHHAGADDPDLPLLAAMVACYQQLSGQPPVALFQALGAAANRHPEFRSMLAQQVLEPLAMGSHRAALRSFSPVDNPVSRAVRQQYEENPYPRWRSLGEINSSTFDNRIARALVHLPADQKPGLQALPEDELDILIAGCGTGRNALWCAREYPNTRIFAVDLSSASLAYAMMKAAELGIENIDFQQGDLLELPSLGRQFDVIEAIGVLHHMDKPAMGLAALAHCLRPGGWMKVALYSHLARGAVRAARARIAERGYPPTADGIRAFRHAILSDRNDPLHGPCTNWRDFFSLSECRDLLFHVQEHQFTTQGLAELIAGAGLEFMGFEANPEIPARATPPITDWRSLEQWGEFENAHPDFFGSMYVMWLRKAQASAGPAGSGNAAGRKNHALASSVARP